MEILSLLPESLEGRLVPCAEVIRGRKKETVGKETNRYTDREADSQTDRGGGSRGRRKRETKRREKGKV